jgi:hypothetical protein
LDEHERSDLAITSFDGNRYCATYFPHAPFFIRNADAVWLNMFWMQHEISAVMGEQSQIDSNLRILLIS